MFVDESVPLRSRQLLQQRHKPHNLRVAMKVSRACNASWSYHVQSVPTSSTMHLASSMRRRARRPLSARIWILRVHSPVPARFVRCLKARTRLQPAGILGSSGVLPAVMHLDCSSWEPCSRSHCYRLIQFSFVIWGLGGQLLGFTFWTREFSSLALQFSPVKRGLGRQPGEVGAFARSPFVRHAAIQSLDAGTI